MPKTTVARAWIVGSVVVTLSCFPFSAHDEVLNEKYALVAIDIDEEMAVYLRLPSDAGVQRVPPTVFAVGWNDEWVIAKRHPNADRGTTDYWIINAKYDQLSSDERTVVTGPLSLEEFEAKRESLGVPSGLQFSRVMRSLE